MSQSKKKVAVIGGMNMDIAGFPSKRLVPGDSNPGRTSVSVGGVGRNIAENLALLGSKVSMFSVVGDDIYGKSLLAESSLSGIDMTHVGVVKGASTGTYLAILDENMDMYIAISSMDIYSHLDAEYLSRMKPHIEESSIVVFDTNLSSDNLHFAVELFRDKKLFLDTVSTEKTRKAIDIIGYFHTVKPNKIESQVLTGIQIQDERDLLDSASVLHSKGVVNVCISLGPEGVFFSNGPEKGIVKIQGPRIRNATGAGDAFQAGLVYGELEGISLSESVKIASSAAMMAMDSESTINKEINMEKLMNLATKMEVRKL